MSRSWGRYAYPAGAACPGRSTPVAATPRTGIGGTPSGSVTGRRYPRGPEPPTRSWHDSSRQTLPSSSFCSGRTGCGGSTLCRSARRRVRGRASPTWVAWALRTPGVRAGSRSTARTLALRPSRCTSSCTISDWRTHPWNGMNTAISRITWARAVGAGTV